MHSRTLAALAVLPTLLAVPTLAAAADMGYGYPPILESPEAVPVPVEIGSGWYLRGDMGIDFLRPRVTYGPAPAVVLSSGDSLEGWFGGVGAGLRLNKRFRTDVTVDWRRENFRGGTGLDDLHRAISSAVDVWTGLANVYFDFGSWYSIAPYVGAGAGLAYVDLRAPYISTFQVSGRGSTGAHFAAAAMAGVAFSATDNVKVDLGYRYLWLDDAKGAPDSIGNHIDYRNLSAHELRLGFRYMLD
jgi:opacity protein-like surface antigen